MIFRLIVRRLALGVVTILVVSVLVFFGIEILPGDVAQAILGQGATQGVETACGLVPVAHTAAPATGGAKPKIVNAGGNGITLASGNTIRDLEIGNTATNDDGIFGSNVGNLSVSSVVISGAGGGVDLSNGNLDAMFDAISLLSTLTSLY